MTHRLGAAVLLFALFAAHPALAGYTLGKSVCTSGLVAKGACTGGQVGSFVNTAGRSTLHFSIANTDLADLRDALCPTPPAGETQNDCAARIVREQLERWIEQHIVSDACATADPTPDVE